MDLVSILLGRKQRKFLFNLIYRLVNYYMFISRPSLARKVKEDEIRTPKELLIEFWNFVLNKFPTSDEGMLVQSYKAYDVKQLVIVFLQTDVTID